MRIASPEQMDVLGRSIGEAAVAGTVIALVGDLGAGKSVLARGIGRGLGLTQRLPSPTFVLVAEHDGGRLRFHHADLYRLSDPDELVNLGLDEILGSEGVAAVEWADRFPEVLPGDHLWIEIAIEEDARELAFDARGPMSRALLEAIGG